MKYLKFLLIAFHVMFLISCQKSTEPPINDLPPPGYQKEIPWPSLADSPWPMYHGDPQSTGRSKYAGPTSGIIDWYVDSLYTYSGVSIAADNTIYFISTLPRIGLFAVRPDGSVKWRLEDVITNNVVSTTPLVSADGTIYLGGGLLNSLFAINPDGTIKWEFKSEGSVFLVGMNIGLDGTIYLASGNWGSIPILYALNPDGTEKWSLENPNFNYSELSGISFSPDGKTLYIPGINPSVFAVDVENQYIKWSFGESRLHGIVVVDSEGHLYFQSKVDSINSGQASLYSLNPDGSIRWTYAHDNPNFRLPYAEGTIDKNGNYYFAFDTLYSVNYNGQLRWKLDLGKHSDGPIVSDIHGTVYLPVGWSNYLAISNEGDILWELDFSGENIALGYSPALSSDQIMYLPTYKSEFVYAVK